MKRNFGFTLVELLVVISIIGFLSSIVLSNLRSARSKALNVQRVTEIKQIQTALEYYYDKFGSYPATVSDVTASCGNWDTTTDGVFLPTLSTNGFFNSTLKDPADATCGNFAYYKYPAGFFRTGCPAERGAFYVLGVRNMDKGGFPTSPGFGCPTRDWQSEFDWVTGKYEN